MADFQALVILMAGFLREFALDSHFSDESKIDVLFLISFNKGRFFKSIYTR